MERRLPADVPHEEEKQKAPPGDWKGKAVGLVPRRRAVLADRKCVCVSQAVQPVAATSDLAPDKDAAPHPPLKLLSEIQTPPPEEAAPTPSELQIPSAENSQEAPVNAVDTLTPPPETDSSLSEGFGKSAGEPGRRLQLQLTLLPKPTHPTTSPCVLIPQKTILCWAESGRGNPRRRFWNTVWRPRPRPHPRRR